MTNGKEQNEGNKRMRAFLDFLENRGQQNLLYSLNNYSKQKEKFLFLKNCLQFIRKFVDHVIAFENSFEDYQRLFAGKKVHHFETYLCGLVKLKENHSIKEYHVTKEIKWTITKCTILYLWDGFGTENG